MTNVSDEIAAAMQQYLQETDPTPQFMQEIASDIASVAGELDAVRSPLADKVDGLLVEFVDIAAGQ